MAGDWIKMRVDLANDPAVIALCDSTGLDEDSAVGKLHRLWSWADKHTIDGRSRHVTYAWVDRYLNSPGISTALESVGWLSKDGDMVIFPNFDKHNGESAKKRADGVLRQRASRKRNARVTDRTPLPKSFVRAVMLRDQDRCVFCGVRKGAFSPMEGEIVMSIDHLTPDSRGGLSAVENLVTCCRDCNMEKNDRTPEEWGVLPKYLAKGYEYSNGLVTEKCDSSVTREEKNREEKSIKGVNPLKPPAVAVAIPEELQTVEFDKAWSEWLAYRRERKHKTTERTQRGMLDRLADWGSAIAVQAINDSICNGWQGLFDPRERIRGSPSQHGSQSRHSPNDIIEDF